MSDLPKPAHARSFYCNKCGYVGGSSEHMAPMVRYCDYFAVETSPDLYSEQQMEEYRAASLASAQQRIAELERALERVTWNFRLVLSSKPCRDVSETLAEADAALTDMRDGTP